MIPLDVKKHDVRQWQIGPYAVDLDADTDDTETEAWKAAMKAMHAGEHKLAQTFKIADYHWMIDGNHVVLPQSAGGIALPDGEDIARAILAQTSLETYRASERKWVIDGDIVNIPAKMPDTEASARSVLAKASV